MGKVEKVLAKKFKDGGIPKDLFLAILREKKLPISCDIMNYQYRLTATIEYESAGLFYHKDWTERVTKIIKLMENITGTPIRLVPDEGNRYDPNATFLIPSKVLVEKCKEKGYALGFEPLGYVPQKYTKKIIDYMYAGNVVITIVTGVTPPDPIGDVYPHIYFKTGIYKQYNKNEKAFAKAPF